MFDTVDYDKAPSVGTVDLEAKKCITIRGETLNTMLNLYLGCLFVIELKHLG